MKKSTKAMLKLHGWRLDLSLHNYIYYAKYIDDSLSMSVESGYSIRHSKERCLSCDNCLDRCNFEAIFRDDKGDRNYDSEICMGCGLCIEQCSNEALQSYVDPEKSLPLDLERIERTC